MESDPSTVDDAADLNAVLKWRDIRTRCIKVGERRRLRPVAFFFFLSFFFAAGRRLLLLLLLFGP